MYTKRSSFDLYIQTNRALAAGRALLSRVEQFDEIQRILFRELVLGKFARELPVQAIFEAAIPFFPRSSVVRRPDYDSEPTVREG